MSGARYYRAKAKECEEKLNSAAEPVLVAMLKLWVQEFNELAEEAERTDTDHPRE